MLAGNEGECVMKTGIFKIGVLNVVLYHSITYLIESTCLNCQYLNLFLFWI